MPCAKCRSPDQRQHGIIARACLKKGTTANGDTSAQARMWMMCLRQGNSTPRNNFSTACINHLTGSAMCKFAWSDAPNCLDGCRDFRCTPPDLVLRESPAQLLGNEYQESGKRAVHHPPEPAGPCAVRCRSKSNDICAAAPRVHELDTGPDALHRREAVNAQQTTAGVVKAAKARSRKRDRESARNRSRRTVPQTVCGTVQLGRLWGR